mmetsp:Transcript_103790/g.332601  ORF Transcript_103790/g.332601 Transcript_103790/m.332601 type:complete len:242 (-) Transcript_103790:1685-2410(-)
MKLIWPSSLPASHFRGRPAECRLSTRSQVVGYGIGSGTLWGAVRLRGPLRIPRCSTLTRRTSPGSWRTSGTSSMPSMEVAPCFAACRASCRRPGLFSPCSGTALSLAAAAAAAEEGPTTMAACTAAASAAAGTAATTTSRRRSRCCGAPSVFTQTAAIALVGKRTRRCRSWLRGDGHRASILDTTPSPCIGDSYKAHLLFVAARNCANHGWLFASWSLLWNPTRSEDSSASCARTKKHRSY